CTKRNQINAEIERVSEIMVGANKKVQEFLEAHNSTPLKTAASLAELIRRPELDYEALAELDPDREAVGPLSSEVIEQINIDIKYEGYITRQKQQVEHFKKMEKRLIPADINYDDVSNLRKEARQKLNQVRPASLGQASRISGVSPADVSVLMIYLTAKS
ncbi:MAG: tRNA uridine-5-carboxymethylaminomethyl(34) synthesis enzyme MnmG, partial [Lachnospiraceae bacterium]|nr:tRNA uridine-5-carboxymethylaminomethyl(34) synthesis enzyme MnmG [Lachnospiraceae bacterium]